MTRGPTARSLARLAAAGGACPFRSALRLGANDDGLRASSGAHDARDSMQGDGPGRAPGGPLFPCRPTARARWTPLRPLAKFQRSAAVPPAMGVRISLATVIGSRRSAPGRRLRRSGDDDAVRLRRRQRPLESAEAPRGDGSDACGEGEATTAALPGDGVRQGDGEHEAGRAPEVLAVARGLPSPWGTAPMPTALDHAHVLATGPTRLGASPPTAGGRRSPGSPCRPPSRSVPRRRVTAAGPSGGRPRFSFCAVHPRCAATLVERPTPAPRAPPCPPWSVAAKAVSSGCWPQPRTRSHATHRGSPHSVRWRPRSTVHRDDSLAAPVWQSVVGREVLSPPSQRSQGRDRSRCRTPGLEQSEDVAADPAEVRATEPTPPGPLLAKPAKPVSQR